MSKNDWNKQINQISEEMTTMIWYIADVEVSDEQEEEETETPMPMTVPCRPSEEEVDRHNLSHLPFRSWCKFCVMGRAQSHPHWQKEKEESGVPVISWDYGYLKEEKEAIKDGEFPMVVWKDSNSKASMAFWFKARKRI